MTGASTHQSGAVLTLGSAYVPTLTYVRDTVQDADTHLLGFWREGDGVSACMACHRDALVALRRILASMKVR